MLKNFTSLFIMTVIGTIVVSDSAVADIVTVFADQVTGVNRRADGVTPVGDLGTFTNTSNATGAPDGNFMSGSATGLVNGFPLYLSSYSAVTGLDATQQANINTVTITVTYRTTESFAFHRVDAWNLDAGSMPEANLADFSLGFSLGATTPLNAGDFPYNTDGASTTKTLDIVINADNLAAGFTDWTNFFGDGGEFVGAIWAIDLSSSNTDWNWEVDAIAVKIDYTAVSGGTDTDGDGLDDSVETNTGVFVDANDTGTDPLVADTDGDGVNDGLEVSLGTDPNNAADTPSLPLATLPIILGIGALAAFYASRVHKSHT